MPIAKPMEVVVLPSPGGVGVIELTTMYLPLGLPARRVSRSGDNLARNLPCGSISSRANPICSATRAMGSGESRLGIKIKNCVWSTEEATSALAPYREWLGVLRCCVSEVLHGRA